MGGTEASFSCSAGQRAVFFDATITPNRFPHSDRGWHGQAKSARVGPIRAAHWQTSLASATQKHQLFGDPCDFRSTYESRS
jgi:hypothetical protein